MIQVNKKQLDLINDLAESGDVDEAVEYLHSYYFILQDLVKYYLNTKEFIKLQQKIKNSIKEVQNENPT